MDYIYQIQKLHRSRWIPAYEYGKSTPMEYKSLDEAYDKARLLHSRCSDVRIIKIETFIIHSFTD